MWNYVHSEELYHHGIKGMKWGVRRFQNKDGTLTNAGKKRYSDGVIDSTKQAIATTGSAHRTRLEKQYIESGKSKAEAKAAADRRIKVEKAIAITAGLTVAACAAYYVKNKWVADHCDQILKAGTSFHNLDSAANPRPGEHLYVNYRQNDNNYFRGHFAVNKMRKTGSVFDHTLTATEDIKIPSLDTRKSTFKELYKNDPEFRDVFNRHSRSGKHNKSYRRTYKKMWSKFGDKNDPEFNVAKRKYFDALRQKGYEAIVDEWDTRPTVFRSDAPLILLNTSSKSFGEMTIKELQSKDILLAQANSKSWETRRDLVNGVTNYRFHANKFKESEKYLSKYANKTARNSAYIDKYLNSFKGSTVDTVSLHYAKKRDGSLVAKAGKYTTKNSKLTADSAMKRAKLIENGKTFVAAGTALAGYGALSTAGQKYAVEQYIAEHPNTKLSNAEIRKMLNKQGA